MGGSGDFKKEKKKPVCYAFLLDAVFPMWRLDPLYEYVGGKTKDDVSSLESAALR